MSVLTQTLPPPLIPSPDALPALHPVAIVMVLLATLALCLVIASVYKATHRGLSYSQAFQFSLVLLGMLGASIMMIASAGILAAVGIIGGFSVIRFRTAVKDPKDMAYLFFVLAVGIAMGAQLYYVGVITTVVVCLVSLILTRLDFGVSYDHESIVRLTCVSADGGPVETATYEEILGRLARSSHLLSAVGHGSRMELTYGVRPRRDVSVLAILQAFGEVTTVEHAELFDAKHQVEF